MLTSRRARRIGQLGLTELFFETVEPENADVPIDEVLATLPAGNYKIAGPAMENGESDGQDIRHRLADARHPGRPRLLSPRRAPPSGRRTSWSSWSPVTETITRRHVEIIAYQLIIEKDEPPHPHMIGKIGLSIYLPASVTSDCRPGRVPRARHALLVGSAGDRRERQPDALFERISDAVRPTKGPPLNMVLFTSRR